MIKTNCKITLFGDNIGAAYCTLGDSTPKFSDRPYYRVPWSDIPSKRLQACNLAFTLNADCRVDFDVYDRKISNPKLINLLLELKKKDIVKKITCVYEYGEKGKLHGKLHYHGIASVNDRETFEKAILQTFNKRSDVKHRTLHTKLFKAVVDRDRYLNYMKKEEQNKKKCLFTI